jgi:hypothetical protein
LTVLTAGFFRCLAPKATLNRGGQQQPGDEGNQLNNQLRRFIIYSDSFLLLSAAILYWRLLTLSGGRLQVVDVSGRQACSWKLQ